MNKYIISGLIVIALIVGGLFWHNNQVENYKQEIVTQIANDYNKRIIILQNNADAKEAELLKQIQENKGEAIIQRDLIVSNYESIIAGLQQRPKRSTSSSNSTGNTRNGERPTGATGKELYRDDAEFLAGFSRETALIQSYLLQCYKDYEAVKDAFEKFKRENPTRFVTPDNP